MTKETCLKSEKKGNGVVGWVTLHGGGEGGNQFGSVVGCSREFQEKRNNMQG